MSGKEAFLRHAYTELAKAETSRDMEKALRTANRILKQYPHETTAFKCKVVSLIHLNKFEETLNLIRKSAPSITRGAHFERAYCEYRLYQTKEAVETLETAAKDLPNGELELPCQELLAQLYYRLEKFDESEKIYLKLMKHMSDDFEAERQTNLMAARAQMIVNGKAQDTLKLPLDSFEHQYNHACALIAKGDYKKAYNMLSKAHELCRVTLADDGVPDDEIEDEQAIISTQMAYCQQMMGKETDALEHYNDVLKQRPTDASVAAVASNNVVSIRQEANLFDARKKLKVCQGGSVENKLLSNQTRVVAVNNALLQLHSNQLDACKRALTDINDRYGTSVICTAIEAALLQRQKNTNAAVKLIDKTLKSDISERDRHMLLLTMAALLFADGNSKQACSTLQSIDRIRHEPAIVSVFTSVALAANDTNKALQALQQAAQHFEKDTSDSSRNNLAVILEQIANLQLKLNQQDKACDTLEKLRALRPNDPKIVSRLMRLYGDANPTKAEQLSQELPRLMASVSTQDNPNANLSPDKVDVLEQSESILYKSKKPTTSASPDKKATDSVKRRRKRKRKVRLPKNYDPSIPVDPERWLPRQERSTFKRKKDKRMKDKEIGRGPQGAVSAAQVEKLDQSNKPDVQSSPKSSPAVSSPAGPGPRQQRPAQARKKKGGKKF